MAIMKVYAVRDIKADLFKPPFTCATNGVALRAFADACNDKQSDLGVHPEDYELFHVGEFDDSQGVVRPVEHVRLGLGSEFVKAPEPVPALRRV